MAQEDMNGGMKPPESCMLNGMVCGNMDCEQIKVYIQSMFIKNVGIHDVLYLIFM